MRDVCNTPFCKLDGVGLGWGILVWAGLVWDRCIISYLDVAVSACLVTSIAYSTCQIESSILFS